MVPFRTALRAWFGISLQTFGGPAGQIAVMQRALVDDRRWISHRRFLHALNYCMLLPGPEAHQLAIYVGWLLNGLRGGLTAGVLFVLPGVVALLALSALYVGLGDTTVVAALFTGLGAAVVAVVAQAVVRVAGRALTHPLLVALAVAAFLALAVFAVPFPIVIAAAAVIGWLAARRIPGLTSGGGHGTGDEAGPPPLIADDALHHRAPSTARTLRILAAGLVIWTAPIGLVALLTGTGSVYTTQGLFFAGTALVTFGGAYAVLAFVAQQAVQTYGWLSSTDMVRGLATRRVHARPADHGRAVRGVSRRLRRPRPAVPVDCRRDRVAAGHVGDLRAELPVHLPRRPLHRAAAEQPGAGRRHDRHHRRGRRRHRQPRGSTSRSTPCSPPPAPSTPGRWRCSSPTRRACARYPWPSASSRPYCCSPPAGRCCASSASPPFSASPPGSSACR